MFHLGIYYQVAILAYLLLCLGLLNRRNRALHASLMSAGILLDLTIVLLLEFNRHVIGTAVHANFGVLERGHIIASSIAVVFYIPTVLLGLRRLFFNGSLAVRRWHIRCGICAFIFRTLGFILMFSMLDNPK